MAVPERSTFLETSFGSLLGYLSRWLHGLKRAAPVLATSSFQQSLGGRPLNLTLPVNSPIELPMVTNRWSSTDLRLLSARISRVSRPWIVLASAERCRPSLVFAPVDNPPCVRQTALPFMAGARHCCWLRLDVALHCRQVIFPPSVSKILLCSASLDIFDTVISA